MMAMPPTVNITVPTPPVLGSTGVVLLRSITR